MDPANRQPRARPFAPIPPLGAGRGFGRVGSAWLGILFLLSCGEPSLTPTPEERFTILPGTPEARYGSERLDEASPGEQDLRTSRPRVCENFAFPKERGPLDLLLVPDFGRSMADRKDEILDAIEDFLDQIFFSRKPSFRVGILAASAPAEGERLGWLVPLRGTHLFVTCAPGETGEPCTFGDWQTVRAAIVDAIDRVASSPTSLGLLALTEALDPFSEANVGFLRPEAELHVVVISDADDLSCPSRIGAGAGCHSFEACGCSTDAEYGRVEAYVRALRSSKGFGFEDRVTLSAWVATTSDPLPTEEGIGFFAGCSVSSQVERCATPWADGEPCALRAPRYAAVARALGGEVADLCGEPDGLAKIGALITGASPTFPLQRKPLPTTLETVLLSFPDKSCNHRDSCLEEGLDCIRGRCGQVVSEGGADGWQYVSCSSGIPRNMVRFERSDRLRNRKIEICYDVDVGADPLPCP